MFGRRLVAARLGEGISASGNIGIRRLAINSKQFNQSIIFTIPTSISGGFILINTARIK